MSALPGVASPEIGGVVMGRSVMQHEASRSLGIARRIGKRLMHWLSVTQKQTQALERVVGRDPETGKNLTELVLDANGKQIDVPILPDEEVRKTWELYERTVRNLLVEQRARAAMLDGRGAPPMDDAAFEAQIRELAQRAVLEMPRAELDALLKQRRIDIAANVASTSDTPAREEAIGGDPDDPENAGHQAPIAGARVSEASPAPQDGKGDFLNFGGDDD